MIVHRNRDLRGAHQGRVNILKNSNHRVKRTRLAIVAGHPVQYVAPWLAQLAKLETIEIHVFYLWDFGVVETRDPGFGITIEWDIPLLENYPYSFVRNLSRDPGNHHFMGYINPTLATRVSEWKPDVIFLMNYAFLSYFLLLIDPRLWRTPLIFRGDSHDMGRKQSVRSKLSKAIRKLVFSRFSAFLDVGQNNRNYILTSGVSPEKVFHAPHAIDNRRFQSAKLKAKSEAIALREQLGIGKNQILICFVGKLIPIKRPFDLLNAFSDIPKELRDRASLLYVGDGQLKASLKASGDHLNSLHFLEFQNQSSMPAVYAASDLLVLPSQSETWGLVVNEAMNLSCPVIVSDHVGCAPDLVIPDYTGWVFPTGNTAALSKYLAYAIANPRQLREMGDNAADLISRSSFESLTKGLLDAIAYVKADQPSKRLKSAKTDA